MSLDMTMGKQRNQYHISHTVHSPTDWKNKTANETLKNKNNDKNTVNFYIVVESRFLTSVAMAIYLMPISFPFRKSDFHLY